MSARILILSGAGLSAGGLWDRHAIERLATGDALKQNRNEVLAFYNARRQQLAEAQPNPAHLALAQLQRSAPQQVQLITQNVDDLLERAGASEVVHLHGKLTWSRCTYCDFRWEVGYAPQEDDPLCPDCGRRETRPDVVLFGEPAPAYPLLYDGAEQLGPGDLFVVIGTSGVVLPINYLVGEGMQRLPCRTLLCNLEPSPEIEAERFDQVIYAPISRAIDRVVEACRQVLR